jgi:hypothetical protein
MAAQITQVGDAQAQLADFVGPPGIRPEVKQVEKQLLPLQGGQLGGDPGMLRHQPEILQHRSQGNFAADTHLSTVCGFRFEVFG